MAFELPQLKFPYDALEPHIDAMTMEIHFTKHHQTYVTNLNKALEGQDEFAAMTIEELLKNVDRIPDQIKTMIRNNGGGHYNHSLFWNTLTSKSTLKPSGQLLKGIEETFSSFDNFKEQFSKNALGRFGSGWAWLYMDPHKKLALSTTPNQDNPLMEGYQPILGLDVWEHAYYLKYQNRRADYIKSWWEVVDWFVVEDTYTNLLKA